MNRNLRRVLTAGASVGALSVPAYAAQHTLDCGPVVACSQVFTEASPDLDIELGDAADGYVVSETGAVANTSTATLTYPADFLVYQEANATTGTASLSIVNAGTLPTGGASITATAVTTDATVAGAKDAEATIGAAINDGAVHQLGHADAGEAEFTFDNKGDFSVAASATATAASGDDANAQSLIYPVVLQEGQAEGLIDQDFNNTKGSTFKVVATSTATSAGGATETATADSDAIGGVIQFADTAGIYDSGAAELTFANDGAFTVQGVASATGAGTVNASALAGFGAVQIAEDIDAPKLTATNTAALKVDSSATAGGVPSGADAVDASAEATSGLGLGQIAFDTDLADPFSATLVGKNTSSIDVTSAATASGENSAEADSDSLLGVIQVAGSPNEAAASDIKFNNDPGSTINVGSVATANSGKGAAASGNSDADALSAAGLVQVGIGNVKGAATNNGTVSVKSKAVAGSLGTDTTGTATADAISGVGIAQASFGANSDPGSAATWSLTNKKTAAADTTPAGAGAIVVDATSSADAIDNADASSIAGVGAAQIALFHNTVTLDMINDGSVDVTATSTANNTEPTGGATAGGNATSQAIAGAGTLQIGSSQLLDTDTGPGRDTKITGSNTANGTINVKAKATSTGDQSAQALAVGGLGAGQIALSDADESVASTKYTNDGKIAVSGDASATAETATAFGIGGAGVVQLSVADTAGGSPEDATATAEFVQSTTGSISVTGTAKASADGNVGGEVANTQSLAGIGLGQAAINLADGGNAGAIVKADNSGAIAVTASSESVGTNKAGALAQSQALAGFGQAAIAAEGDAIVDLQNKAKGTVKVAATSTAKSATGAQAVSQANGGIQFVLTGDDDQTANATVNNAGLIDVASTATATGDLAAQSVAQGSGVTQIGIQTSSSEETGPVNLLINNAAPASDTAGSGTISVKATATSTAADKTGNAVAISQVTTGLAQVGQSDDGNVNATITNAGKITVGSSATSTGGASAVSQAVLGQGIAQSVTSSDGGIGGDGKATAKIDNTGSIDLNVAAVASSTQGSAGAIAVNGFGGGGSISQTAVGSSATFTNTGTTKIATSSKATGVTGASATSATVGTTQVAATNASGDQDAAIASFDNKSGGTYAVTTDAASEATGAGAGAAAVASGVGLQQSVFSTKALTSKADFNNAGTFSVASTATAKADNAAGIAVSQGVNQVLGSSTSSSTVTNSGKMSVSATATGTGKASGATAIASGVTVAAGGGAKLETTILNSGELNVVANASSTTAKAAAAGASGITVSGGTTRGPVTITNTGALNVDAVVSDSGSTAQAFGIVNGASGTTPVTINNQGGTIRVRESTNGGKSYTWGDAIKADFAGTAPTAINLEGGTGGKVGNIYGNIEIDSNDTVTVKNGETRFDGLVNAAPYATWASGKAPVLVGEGTFNIAAGGTLVLVDSTANPLTDNGPSHIFVENFNVAAASGSTPAGVLALELPASPVGGVQTVNTYPSVVADKANITGGTLEVRPISTNGLYANSYTYEDVVDANVLTGKFGTVRSTSVLLTPTASYDANNNVDLKIDRVHFDAVPGLTINQTSTGGGIEHVYTPTLTGAFAGVVSDLFLIGDAATYADALDQLSGVQYAGYLRKLGWMGTRFNGLLSDMSECQRGQVVSEICRDAGENGVRVWGKLNYGVTDTDGDVEAGGFETDQWFAALGVDFSVGPDAILGIAGAYVENKMDFDEFNGSIDSKGWQLGVYGAYDPGQYYIKGAFSYSDLNADSYRELAIGTHSTGAIEGDPDAKIWAFNLEAGYRIPLGANATLTPYAQFDYASVKMSRFDETGLPGANLSVRGKDEFAVSELGLELSGQMGGVVPSLKLGWQHAFTNDTADFTARFIDAPTGSDFRIISEDFSADSAIVEVSLAGQLSPNFDASIGYQGRFSSDVERHAGMISLSYLFGAAPPPPPPAPPPPPPPPPPAPPVAECQKGPYIVFFDWDKSDITAEAAGILDSAVTAYGNCDVVPIMLAGYTDTSGSKQYNLGLAGRRNESVRGYLTARNIPNDRITSQAFGEANPRVPTGDGVRELQNRRVEITYGPGSGM